MPELKPFDQLDYMFGECIPEEVMIDVGLCSYTRPAPVQKYVMPARFALRDVMCSCGQRQSSIGKKVAYLLVPAILSMMRQQCGTACLQALFEDPCMLNELILSQTRDLCARIFTEALWLCHGMPFQCTRTYGKEVEKARLQDLASGADLIVATPRRWLD